MTWAPDYCTVDEVKSYLRIGDTSDDVLLALWVTAASRAVDKHCGRQFGQVGSSETREYRAEWDTHTSCWVAQIDDVYDSTGLTVTGPDSQGVTDFEFGPANAIQKGKVYERLLITRSWGGASCVDNGWWGFPFGWPYGQVRRKPYAKISVATDKWGWNTPPVAAKTATMLQTARLAARRDSPYGISGSPQEQGELRLLATLDPDLKTSLSAFRRDWWAA